MRSTKSALAPLHDFVRYFHKSLFEGVEEGEARVARNLLEASDFFCFRDRCRSGRILRGGARGSAFTCQVGTRRGGVHLIRQRCLAEERGARRRGRHRGEWEDSESPFPEQPPPER